MDSMEIPNCSDLFFHQFLCQVLERLCGNLSPNLGATTLPESTQVGSKNLAFVEDLCTTATPAGELNFQGLKGSENKLKNYPKGHQIHDASWVGIWTPLGTIFQQFSFQFEGFGRPGWNQNPR